LKVSRPETEESEKDLTGAPKSKISFDALDVLIIGAWNFLGAWSLEFGA
jgi:hypothetical protein